MVIFKSKRMWFVSIPKDMLEKDCGDIATRMNMTSRIGTEMVAVQIMMPVATRARTLQEKIVHQVDC